MSKPLELIELIEQHPEIPEPERVRLIELANEIRILGQHQSDIGVVIIDQPHVPIEDLEKILTRVEMKIDNPTATNRAQRRAAKRAKGKVRNFAK
jgi:hypothetical protein